MQSVEDYADLVTADESDYDTSRDAILYVIDVSKSMLERCSDVPDNKNCVQLALEGAFESIADRITASPLDMAGVLLYGTEKDTDPEYPHCTVIMEMGIPDSMGLKRLKRLSTDPEYFNEVCQPEESNGATLLSNVFFLAMRQFERNCPTKTSKRIMLITDNDDPHAEDPQKKLSAKTRAADLVEKGIAIIPSFILKPDRGFEMSKFYDDLDLGERTIDASTDSEEEDVTANIVLPQPASALELKENIFVHHHVKRSMFHLHIELPGKSDTERINIGVKGFLIFKKREIMPTKRVFTDAEKPELVKIKSRAIVQESGRELELGQLKKTFTFGGKSVKFSPEKLQELRTFDDPVIRILGFKPVDAIKDWMNMTHATMVYPSDERLQGSFRAFSALYQSMLKKNKAAIAWCVIRARERPRICALIPSPRPHSADDPADGPNIPQGLHMVPLPFADDVRKKPPVKMVDPPDELVNNWKSIVQMLHMPRGYDLRRYLNPNLEWFFRILQSLALDEELKSDIRDTTVPKFKSINSRAGIIIEQFNAATDKVAEELDAEEQIELREQKRKRQEESTDASLSDHPKKRKKDLGTTYQDFEKAAANKELGEYTVRQLKRFAIDTGIKNAGSSKANLTAAVAEYFEAQRAAT